MSLELFVIFFALIMSEDGSAQNIDLENWMRNLPSPLKNVPLIYLAIPGSHDSMTYGITRSSKVAPDAEPVIHRLYPVFKGSILRWTITQSKDTTEQLLLGIRYFDLRLATKTGTESFFYTHGLYAEEISGALLQVKEFVQAHPDEVVFLDFQHFYNFTPDDHQRLMRLLLNMYGGTLVPRQPDLERITLNALRNLRQQIVIVYRHQAVYATDAFWQPQMLPTPWPQRDRVSGLLNFLTHVKRHPGMGFVHQLVLTPDAAFILLRWTSNLRDKCAVPVKKEVLPVLASDFSPGPPVLVNGNYTAPVNIVIADFVELENAIFPRTIINMNFKLLNSELGMRSQYG